MIINNVDKLATTAAKKRALVIVEAGLKAANPRVALKKHIKKSLNNTFVVAIGKAAATMAKSVCALTTISGGLVIIPQYVSVRLPKKIQVIKAAHPIPSRQSVIAAKQVMAFLQNRKATDQVIFLISGGASALVSLPEGVSLKEKQRVNAMLIRSGAAIHEINCVRKHLSGIKGGRLLESLRCKAVSYVLSDVVGDDLSVIASGLTYCDKTTFAEAKKILLKYKLKSHLPKNVWHRIVLGVRKDISETPKQPKIKNTIILNNTACLKAMAAKAKKLGYKVTQVRDLAGDVKTAAKLLSQSRGKCIIFGGETTVRVKGAGKGGRNQELVLQIADRMKQKKFVVVAVGTDGVDGNTLAAGGIVDQDMPKQEIKQFLQRNDSYHFLLKQKGLIFTAPTQTNLMDIGVLLIE